MLLFRMLSGFLHRLHSCFNHWTILLRLNHCLAGRLKCARSAELDIGCIDAYVLASAAYLLLPQRQASLGRSCNKPMDRGPIGGGGRTIGGTQKQF